MMPDNNKQKTDQRKLNPVHGVPMVDDDGCRDWDFLG